MDQLRSGLHRRNFIGTHSDDVPVDTIRLVSPINRLPIFQGNLVHGDDADADFPEKPSKFKTRVIIGLLVILLVTAASCGFLVNFKRSSTKPYEPPDPVEPLKPSASWLRTFKKAAVCTDALPCSEIGGQILAKNGSAVDAAISTMICNWFLNQQNTGLGGGFFMTVYIRDEKAYTVNAREKAPLAATRDMFQGDASKSSKGPLSIGVPGELRGMWAAHQRWGKLPWADLVTPNMQFCTYGFQISKVMYDGLLDAPYIKSDPILSKMYVDPSTNMFHKPGTIVKPSEAFCKTLRLISERGGDELYNGSLASDFLNDLKRISSIISAEDLRNYQAQIKETIDVRLENGDRLHFPPPPSSGLILANILNILTGYHFGPHSINTTEDKILTYHRIIEAFKFAYATRTKLGDVDFVELDELMRNVTQPEYSTEIRSRINDTMTSNNSATYGAEVYQPSDAGTAHISIIASNGDAVSVTSSINYYYGVGITTLKTGIVMNNVMDDFSSPGITNYFGLEPSPANFIAPGKRPLSSMSPSIISDADGNVKMVLGAAGGTRIPTAVALVAIRKLWFEQSLKEAVDEARIHHQLFPMEIAYEYGITEAIVKGLKAKGHAMSRYRNRGSIVCALYRNKTAIYGNADFRKGGDVSAQIKETIDVRLENGDRLHFPPPPSSGLILANILNILTGYHFGPHSINTTEDKILTYHRIIEAFKFAYATRTKLGDVDFVELDELMRNVTQPEYSTEIRSRINDTMTSNNSATYGAEVYLQPPDAGTAHISIIAGNGDAVSVTSSINYYYGVGITTLNTGIVMNNVMDDFSSPGITNYFGLEPSPANFIAPGKRPLSSMSPSIISDADGNVKMVLGAAGGTRIPTAVALVAIRKLWFEQSLKEAVDEARIHHQLFPMEIAYEYGITEAIVKGLKAKGHAMSRYRNRGSIVCALYRNKTAIYGNADFRKGGDVSGD